jgi:hypothetical protein
MKCYRLQLLVIDSNGTSFERRRICNSPGPQWRSNFSFKRKSESPQHTRLGYWKSSCHHRTSTGFAETECLMRHFPKKVLRPFFLHRQIGHREFLSGHVDELAFSSARWSRTITFTRKMALPHIFTAKSAITCHTNGLAMLSSLARPFTLGLPGRHTLHRAISFCEGMSRTSLRTTPAKWSSRIETALHRRCSNHKQGHTGGSLNRNGPSDWRAPCDGGVLKLSVCKVTYQNFQRFPNSYCTPCDCKLAGYFIINTCNFLLPFLNYHVYFVSCFFSWLVTAHRAT